ncbi:hypothetical protein HN51_059052 [Arachis hypogaea]|uniref:Phosphatidylinositol 4-phosphate 5-kinase n=1 Tax=Arachis hypogaea TaxID=3818 RepID=A0A444X3V0_ARAHY|nr:phosphatidylinositol 4-phosphate 5-kinase 5 [Arachis ipaensis]XP_025682844.1 phosphatidylinositol 4-phosphate 5-kinase 5 [Arachis hypogaea]QHN82422.1 Phosphatidylinositol 4-phosphate 5-kinase [Arachis hypogaea]RYQ84335.1 hypothetical protein Ahy_B10g103531 [Arachis hypogaea]
METPKKSQTKLTRTQSSLLRCSSPTARSPIHNEQNLLEDEEKNDGNSKKTKIKSKSKKSIKPGSNRLISGPVLGFFGACFLSFYLFYFLSFRFSQEVPTSENVLLALIFVAVFLYLISKNRALIHRTGAALRRLSFSSGGTARPVQWSIGDSEGEQENQEEKSAEKEGVEFFSNGDFYEGEFSGGVGGRKSNGFGVYHYFVGGRYEGEWVDGRYEGFGVEGWARGSRYKGQYRHGLRHGFGVYRFYAGDSYAGEWCNGQSHGIGVQSCNDGSSYVGEFKFGVKHGLGCYHFRNGDRYAGEYFGDKIHGFGVYHFANGHCYEGAWHEGRRQGYGLYTFRNGDKRCGEWDSGNLKNNLPTITDAVLRAVQAARKTAEDAVKVDRKDDQVNKAVIAANRAATAARVAAVKVVQNRMGGKFCDTHV